jgi:hypothetical protein
VSVEENRQSGYQYKLETNPPSIVILHGLNGSPHRTFYHEDSGFYWPADLKRLIPDARIMVFGYLADVAAGSSNSLGVYQHAQSLVLQLKNNRTGVKVRKPRSHQIERI